MFSSDPWNFLQEAAACRPWAASSAWCRHAGHHGGGAPSSRSVPGYTQGFTDRVPFSLQSPTLLPARGGGSEALRGSVPMRTHRSGEWPRRHLTPGVWPPRSRAGLRLGHPRTRFLPLPFAGRVNLGTSSSLLVPLPCSMTLPAWRDRRACGLSGCFRSASVRSGGSGSDAGIIFLDSFLFKQLLPLPSPLFPLPPTSSSLF